MLRKTAYLISFGAVGLSSLFFTAIWALDMSGIQVNLGGWTTMLRMFGHPVPEILSFKIPNGINFILCVGLAALILRRLFLMLKARSLSAPASYSGWLYYFMLVPTASLVLAAVVLVASIALSAGSGVPAGLLALPAVFFLPGGVALVEVLSLRSKNERPNP